MTDHTSTIEVWDDEPHLVCTCGWDTAIPYAATPDVLKALEGNHLHDVEAGNIQYVIRTIPGPPGPTGPRGFAGPPPTEADLNSVFAFWTAGFKQAIADLTTRIAALEATVDQLSHR